MRVTGTGDRSAASRSIRLLATAAAGIVLTTGAAAMAQEFGQWSAPEPVEAVNTPTFGEGCPIQSPDGKYLYYASNNSAGHGGLDIWRAPRVPGGWGTPENLGAPVNTAADEFCPDPARGNRLFFVRRLSATNTDIYLTKGEANGWTPPRRLPTGDNAINSPAEEWSPSYFEAKGHEYLYFSSTRNATGTPPTQDIFYSVDFGPAQLVGGGVNSSASDARPNVRLDGLEMVWDSTRTGSQMTDIWTASRSSVDAEWGDAEQLPIGINSAAGESRATLSRDGRTLLFGSTRRGTSDIFTATRPKLGGR